MAVGKTDRIARVTKKGGRIAAGVAGGVGGAYGAKKLYDRMVNDN